MLKRLWQHLFAKVPPTPIMMAPASWVDARHCGLLDAVKSGWFLQAAGELLEGFPISVVDTVLDVGCGEGGTTLFAARCGAEVIFVDADARVIEELNEHVRSAGARAWRGIVSDSDPLPLSDASASRVVAMEVLEHVEDPARVMRELVRVAAPGAKFLLTVPDPVGETLQKGIALQAHFLAPNHIRIFQRDEFEQLIIDAGLVIEKKRYTGFFWSMWMWVCQRAESEPYDGATRDKIAAPYPQLLDQWTRTWHTLINMPEGAVLKEAFDNFMPKSQIIIARKPQL